MNVIARLSSLEFWLQLARYGLVGGALSVLYAGLTAVLIEATNWPALNASIGAFVLSLPFAYLGHRYVTFRSSGSHATELVRFVVTMTNAFVVSSLSMLVTVGYFGAHYGYALLATTVLVTVVNYVVLSTWVFGGRARLARRRAAAPDGIGRSEVSQ
jgi:putative flippase GtrA